MFKMIKKIAKPLLWALFGAFNMYIIGFHFYCYGPISFHATPQTSVLSSDPNALNLFLTMQANQFSLLQIFLTVFAIIIAIAAIWGYSAIEKSAVEHIKENLPNLVSEEIRKLLPEQVAELNVKMNMSKAPEEALSTQAFGEKEEMLTKETSGYNHECTD